MTESFRPCRRNLGWPLCVSQLFRSSGREGGRGPGDVSFERVVNSLYQSRYRRTRKSSGIWRQTRIVCRPVPLGAWEPLASALIRPAIMPMHCVIAAVSDKMHHVTIDLTQVKYSVSK